MMNGFDLCVAGGYWGQRSNSSVGFEGGLARSATILSRTPRALLFLAKQPILVIRCQLYLYSGRVGVPRYVMTGRAYSVSLAECA